MFLCLLGEVLAIYFTTNDPRKLIDGSIPTIFPHKEQKGDRENRLPHRCFPGNSTEFLKTPFLKNTSGVHCLLVFNIRKFC